jgi:hypothetical protein
MRLHCQSVITYMEADQQRIYAFVPGDGFSEDLGLEIEDDHLYLNYWDGSQWMWKDLGEPPGLWVSGQLGNAVGINRAAAVLTYKVGSRPQRIYAFVTADDGHLHAKVWDGTQWSWQALPGPLGGSVRGVAGAVTYREGPQQRIHVFVNTPNGGLHMSYWDGSQWTWEAQGFPTGTTPSVIEAPGVITYQEGTQPRRIHAFVLGNDKHLYMNYWDGSQWKWADQGTPAGTTVQSGPAVITYREGTQPQRIYAFVGGADGHLYVNYWNGSQWKWVDQGTPTGTAMGPSLAPAVITYREGTQPQRIYAFVVGTNAHLYVNYWNGSQWKWVDQGTLSGRQLVFARPAVITYREGTQPQRIYAFVRGTVPPSIKQSLLVNYWNGSHWKWVDQGSL